MLSHHHGSYVAALVLLSYVNLASDLLVASTLEEARGRVQASLNSTATCGLHLQHAFY